MIIASCSKSKCGSLLIDSLMQIGAIGFCDCTTWYVPLPSIGTMGSLQLVESNIDKLAGRPYAKRHQLRGAALEYTRQALDAPASRLHRDSVRTHSRLANRQG